MLFHDYLPFIFTEKHWNNAHNRRNFFIKFASQKGFDPLVAVNWENVKRRDIIKQVKRKPQGTSERWKMEI